ncbi:MAG: hypothetical protein EOP61_19980 [Sphingomonadales bacterium]|nr:MAG: hypothetical protein EOP61_19980 [Sphingomonadales bacterium]
MNISASDPVGIHNWQRLDDRITTSGQPSEQQLGDIRALGVGHVVNLGLHEHEKALPDEGASVAALGMRYIHIPVDFDRPTEDDYARFVATMATLAGETVHVHCIANMRVSAFFYRWRRETLGMDDAEARAAMETIWKPGGAWAELIGDDEAVGRGHQVPGKHY